MPLDAWGPVGKGLSAFLIGRSSTTLQGLMVHVGAIDADYTGQICAMVSTATPPVTIEKGTRLAQLVPFQSCVPQRDNVTRGDGGFGATGKPQVYWVQTVSDQRPQMHCVLELSDATPKKVRVAGL